MLVPQMAEKFLGHQIATQTSAVAIFARRLQVRYFSASESLRSLLGSQSRYSLVYWNGSQKSTLCPSKQGNPYQDISVLGNHFGSLSYQLYTIHQPLAILYRPSNALGRDTPQESSYPCCLAFRQLHSSHSGVLSNLWT